jgi:NAD(P)-dependent dehydrogenase (short-subunit alcohol dehydrogenase family)
VSLISFSRTPAIAEIAGLEQLTEALFDRRFDVNVKSTVFTFGKALPLVGDGASVIVNAPINSVKVHAGLGVTPRRRLLCAISSGPRFSI